MIASIGNAPNFGDRVLDAGNRQARSGELE